MTSLSSLSSLLSAAIHPLPSEEDYINEGYDPLLDEYRALAKGGKKQLAEMCEMEKEKTGVSALKIKYNKVFGYFFEVPLSQSDKLPEYFVRRQTLVNAERFITPSLKEFEDKILSAQNNFTLRQEEIMAEIQKSIMEKASGLQSVAKHVAVADIEQSFCTLAQKNKCTKPVMLEQSSTLEIEKGRHIVVEKSLEKGDSQFIPNSLSMDSSSSFHLITGPNMAGKSTFLRQNAIIVYMAHLGSFVPAHSAKIPLCDSIFTRIGSGDSLSTGESTFLVEMQEASKILRHATSKSFVILDEIGRGTSTYDGLSIAWAIMDFLHEKGVNTLFATHYHELIALAKKLKNAKNFSARVLEDERKGVIFLHQIFEGGAEKSFGIEVAKLAGLPSSVITKAEQILSLLEQGEKRSFSEEMQVSLFDTPVVPEKITPVVAQKSALEKELESMDINTMTPLEVMMKVEEWKRSV